MDRIHELLKQKESINLEFKEAKRDIPKDLYETVCAFLNREGGIILLGVENSGYVVGVDEDCIQQILVDIASTLNNNEKLDPTYLLIPQILEIRQKKILFIQVPESSRVHRLNGIIFDRSADGDFKVKSPEQIAELSNRKALYFSEAKVFPYLAIPDFDKNTLKTAKNYIQNQEKYVSWSKLSTEEWLEKAGFWRKDNLTGKYGYTLASALLFGKEETIQSILPFYKTDMLVKKENVNRYDDRLDLRVNLIESYPSMLRFIEKHLPDPFYLEGYTRISLRHKIFREIIANFLIHREYTKVDPARIIIYKDRIEATNPCYPRHKGLLTPKNSIPFQKNPLISKFFLQLGWVEEIGSGLINVTEYLPRYHQGAHVEFLEDDIFQVIIHLPSATDDTNHDTNDTNRDTDKGLESDTEKLITMLMKENSSITLIEIAEKINKHRSTVLRYIEALKEKKIIKRVGSTRKGEWKVINREEQING